jgi:hypothetical protein
MRFGPVVLACWIVGCGPPQAANRVSSERGSGGAGGSGRMDARSGSGGAGSPIAGNTGTGGGVATGGVDGIGGSMGPPDVAPGTGSPDSGGTGGSGGTGPIDAAMEPTSSPMLDAAPDTTPPPDAPPMIPCPMPAADEGIASFEGGLTSDRVGDRGGTPWTVLAGTLDPAMGITGAIAPATAPPRCGSTTFLRFTGMANATRTPITRTLFRSGSTAQFFNASAFKGIRMFLRSTGGGTVRIKVPDRNTALPGGVCMTCNDHFITDLNVTADWQLFTVAFAQLKQMGTGDPQPALASGALYSLEIVAPKTGTTGTSTAPFTLEVDDISFFR